MNTLTLATETTVVTDAHAELRNQVVEQVMRTCADLDLAAAFCTDAPTSNAAKAAVGRVLSSSPGTQLVHGSPLVAWVTGSAVSPTWRAACPPAPSSAYAHLEFLATLYPHVRTHDRDLFDVLLELEDLAGAELAA